MFDGRGGGLEGGSVAGLRGMWKYLGCFGRSIVEIDVRDLVLVGAWYVMPNPLWRPVM